MVVGHTTNHGGNARYAVLATVQQSDAPVRDCEKGINPATRFLQCD